MPSLTAPCYSSSSMTSLINRGILLRRRNRSIRSGLLRIVLLSDSFLLHLRISSWFPERSASGTSIPRNSRGRVYWGYSSNPSLKLSSTGDSCIAEDTRHQPGNSVYHDESRRLPP